MSSKKLVSIGEETLNAKGGNNGLLEGSTSILTTSSFHNIQHTMLL